MKGKKWLIALGISISITGLRAQQLPYQNKSLTAEERARDLIGRLTLEEKAGLMQNASVAVPRLGIKEYNWWNEALHGIARSGKASVFPQAIGMAASFDDALLFKVFDAVSDEARVKYNHYNRLGEHGIYQGLTFWTPNINIFRDPRWGRGQETYGEDPYLTSRLGVAVVEGLQGSPDSRYVKTHACAKHYAVHSGPEWNRHSFNAENISARDLWETYLPAFEDLVKKAKVKEVMCAYNSFEGEPCCGSNRLLTQILRDGWKYDGIVVSDCGAISDFYNSRGHKTHPDATHASADAVLSGTDLECGNNYKTIPDAVRAGLISEDKINISLMRLLKARFELGEMDDTDPWRNMPDSVLNSHLHQQLALKMAHESIVLLQNKDNILPLGKNLKVVIMGPNANDSTVQWGNYNGVPFHTETLLSAIKAKLPDAHVSYEYGCDRTSDLFLNSKLNECSIDGIPGFKAVYWNNMKYQGDTVARTRVNYGINFSTLDGTSFAPGVDIKNFSASYKTVFTPSESGAIVYKVLSSGGYDLFINGEKVAEGKRVSSFPLTIYSQEVEAGKSYNIEARYNQYFADGYFQFYLGKEEKIDVAKMIDRIKDVDIVVFAGGISPRLEGEEMNIKIPGFRGGDRTNIELPDVQRNLLAAMKKAGKKIVIVNFSGSAMGFVPETNSCDAIIQAWYPGQSGGTAIADVIFGDYNPSGKLPVTFYKNVEQLPDFEDYNMTGRTYRYMKNDKPLFPFGFGLSYTKFAFGEAIMSKKKVKVGDDVSISIPVANLSSRDGEEVVQIYIERPDDKDGPVKTLRSFSRISLRAGEKTLVDVKLPASTFDWFDNSAGILRPMAGKYKLLYGNSSRDEDLKSIWVDLKK